jgi:hypothetical protein
MTEFCPRHPRFYALYFKDDSEKTEVAVGGSISEVLADVQAQTGRPFLDFQFREISRSEFESLNPFGRGLIPAPLTAFCSSPKQPGLH